MSREPMGVVIPPDKGDANERKTPAEWAAERGYRIMDPDGWRQKDAPPFDQPLTLAEFLPRFNLSTIGPLDWGRATQKAPQEPQAPSSAPDTPQPVSPDPGDGSEALRAALAEALYGQMAVDRPWSQLHRVERQAWMQTADALMPHIEAWGRERAAQAVQDAGDAYGVNFGVRRFMRERAGEIRDHHAEEMGT